MMGKSQSNSDERKILYLAFLLLKTVTGFCFKVLAHQICTLFTKSACSSTPLSIEVTFSVYYSTNTYHKPRLQQYIQRMQPIKGTRHWLHSSQRVETHTCHPEKQTQITIEKRE